MVTGSSTVAVVTLNGNVANEVTLATIVSGGVQTAFPAVGSTVSANGAPRDFTFTVAIMARDVNRDTGEPIRAFVVILPKCAFTARSTLCAGLRRLATTPC